MPAKLHIGCCGWSYLIEKHFTDLLVKPHASKLQSYAQLFDLVEINSSYYGIPKLSTAEKWRAEAGAIDPKFEFTVKAYQGITHTNRFNTKARQYYVEIDEVCAKLDARNILFQSPANFHPTTVNIQRMRDFFSSVDRAGKIFVWEPRGKWYEDPSTIIEVCQELNLIHCVDPFRNEPLVFGREKLTYFRLHGFGKPSIYSYNFSEEELNRLYEMVQNLRDNLKDIYILFNNVYCYENGYTFANAVAVG